MSSASIEHTIDGVRAHVARARAEGRTVALVPTMGALHAGHVSLVQRASELADTVIVSIFVNPLQFGQGEDFDRYPRTLDADVAALAKHPVSLVFAPDAAEMYPGGASQTRITAGPVASLFEGAVRPGHFDGMLTVVAKLLNIVQPDVAVFGQKDAQQLFLVRRMVAELNLPVRIDAAPIVREPGGLALSSRNRYLSAEEKRAALVLSTALAAAADAGAQGADAARAAAHEVARAEPGAVLDYAELVDPATFKPVAGDFAGEALAIIAARVGATRLIDNRATRIR
ncbi:pantothenate synthetase [Homoserinimonas aerilata]|uniref:Pantothenate synthetase n=1 Tax=Homoserinimonas aerilata TaxID=1162970 RepID=A0A542Y1L3_9MICO|nr:pantoate--beta-alanine ligase [Homoserinimonas aerilata]TQL41978.1 pantothenate synthetase [Homoserinimonas aerilata]